MPTYQIEIPGWRPALLNELMGRHPLKIHRRKGIDRRAVARAALVAGVVRVGVPPFEREQRRALGLLGPIAGDPVPIKRKVEVIITDRFRRFPDPDSVAKSLLDALVHSGLLVDDDQRWAVFEPPRFRRGERGSVITLTDLGEPEA